jgi:diguanylate cyclase (GGDEF)-like protein
MFLVICNIYTAKKSGGYSSRYMLFMCWSTILMLFIDGAAWLALYIPGRTGYTLTYLFNFLLFLFSPLTVIFWLNYVYVHLKESYLSKKEIFLFSFPFFLNMIPMALTISSGFVFSVDDFNQYHRGPGIYFIMCDDLLAILLAFFFALRNKDKISRKFMTIVVTFSLIPIIATMLQILFYGISLTWPFIALGVLLTYIFMEVQNNVRDHLTGLTNRKHFEELVQNHLFRSSFNRSFVLVVVDMNHFKEINDNYGHEAGDRALQAAALLLNRAVDVKDTVARVGGDEFGIFLDRVDEDMVEKILNRIRENLGLWNSYTDEPFSLSMSFGYAQYDRTRYRSYKELFKAADMAMYKDKRAYKKSLQESASF